MWLIPVDNLLQLGVNDKIIRVLKKNNITELYEHQFDALRNGILSGQSMIVNVPTAGGKTLIAEIGMVNRVINDGVKAVYITPLRALAYEKFRDFKKWKKLALNIAISTGDFSSKAEDVKNADILVTTIEKFDSIIRHRANWLDKVGVIVVDEFHVLGEPKRGAILENILIWAKETIQIIGLSATVGNLESIGKWLGAKVYRSAYRPVELRKGVFNKGKIYWEDGKIENKTEKDWYVLVRESIENNKNVLVFVNSRNQAESIAKRIAQYLDVQSSINDSDVTDEVYERFGDMIYSGVVYHHGGLSSDVRRWVEDMFRRNKLNVVVATPTLAMGVNMPAWRVIIKDIVQFDKKYGLKRLDVVDVWQMMGRAGRPQYSKYGEAIIVVKKSEAIKPVMDRYIYGKVENIMSKMIISDVMYGQVLSLIAGFGYQTVDEIVQHYKDSLFMYQFGIDRMIRNKVEHVVDWLLKNFLVETQSLGYGSYEEDEFEIISPTDLGKRVAELYIMPQTAVIMLDYMDKIKERRDEIAILHLISILPDFEPIAAKQKDIEWLWKDAGHVFERSYVEWNGLDNHNIRKVLGEVKTVLILEEWINGVDESEIIAKYKIGRGDLTKIVEYAEWLMYSLSELYKLEYEKDEVYKWLKDLTVRIKYGVPKEMLDLVKIKGIGRKKAKDLYNKGIKSIEELKRYGNARLKELGLRQGTLDLLFGGGINEKEGKKEIENG